VVRLAILMIAFWGLPAVPASAAEPGCLACHLVHYADLAICVDCHRGDSRSTRPAIAHRGLISARYAHFTLEDDPLVVSGSKQIKTSACRRCHIICRQGNHLAADLDQSVNLSDPPALAESIRHPVLYMPDFQFPDEILYKVVNALFAAGVGREVSDLEVPQVVHFEERDEAKDNVFVKNCGACHRMLTAALGGLGHGDVAPNLSGLLTEFYPRSIRGQERWSAENLQKSLKNPRGIRPEAQMPPVHLEQKELNELLDILEAEAALGEQGAKRIKDDRSNVSTHGMRR